MKRRHQCPVIPARVIRKTPSTFKVIYYPPLEFDNTGDEQQDDVLFMGRVNDMISAWIREYPGQWMWQHNRWKVERILKIRKEKALQKAQLLKEQEDSHDKAL